MEVIIFLFKWLVRHMVIVYEYTWIILPGIIYKPYLGIMGKLHPTNQILKSCHFITPDEINGVRTSREPLWVWRDKTKDGWSKFLKYTLKYDDKYLRKCCRTKWIISVINEVILRQCDINQSINSVLCVSYTYTYKIIFFHADWRHWRPFND